MNTKIIFDSHCHVFNGSIIRDMIHLPFSSKKMSLVKKESILKSWLDYIKEMSSVLIDSESDNNNFLIKTMMSNFPTVTSFATVPLMMDIHYLFADDMQAGQSPTHGTLDVTDLQDQINSLKTLSKNGNCYPFFAVDPRRAGIVEAIISGQFVTRKNGDFYGIKLYPRLGYHPMTAALPEMYKHCADNCIPITTHCTGGGFPSWSSPSDKFCDPENFRPALEANPTLKINFAHFGGTKVKWIDSIVDLMTKYPFVYSDLSCHTNISDLNRFKKKYWNIDIVRQRIIYGSDYAVFYFTDLGVDLEDYINNFKTVFTESELDNMMSVLPEIFLFA
jgi:hypothetical protein